jgi:protein O-mannosyl-transferase
VSHGRPLKTPRLEPGPATAPDDRRARRIAAALLVAAGLAAYAGSFTGPFVFDDPYSITLNGTIRHFATALSPPGNGTTVSGRPLLNLSFALNYAISGLQVWSYHALNLLIHLLAGLTLFGLVRRTLRRREGSGPELTGGGPPAPQRSAPESASLGLAFFVALLWLLHPLQTESVTYVVQRSESLMGLFYLLTLYCFLRGATAATAPGDAGPRREPAWANAAAQAGGARGAVEGAPTKVPGPAADAESATPRPDGAVTAGRLWFPAAIGACLLGVLTKEVTVSAPVLVLLYDRTFLAGSFREAWRRRRWWYYGLFASWVPLAGLVVNGANRGGTAGIGVGVGFWQYAATQFGAVTRYLSLSLWPHPLIIDYGTHWVTSIPDVVPAAVVVAVVVAGTAVALWRRPALGFLGAWFLAILAPTSLVPGIRQTIVEHRMYLALAPVVVALVLGLHALLRRRAWPVLLALAAAAGWLTAQRNRDYRSDLALWRDTVAKHPGNSGPHLSLGDALYDRGQPAAALAQFEAALRLNPDDADAYYNAANALLRLGRMDEAIGHFQAALQLRPGYFEAHTNLGEVYMRTGRYPEAVKQYEAAVLLEPGLAEAYYNLGNALSRAGRIPAAIRELEWALRLRPDYSAAQNNLGNLLTGTGNAAAALAHYQAAVAADPANVEARANLGTALWKAQRLPEAAEQFAQVERVQPGSAEAAQNLGTIYLHLGRLPQAARQFERVLRLQPDNATAHRDLGIIFGRTGRYQEAADQLRAALRGEPRDALTHYNLGAALLALGRSGEARAEFEAALRLQPDLDPARRALNRLDGAPADRQ